jgi:hypothetical protein
MEPRSRKAVRALSIGLPGVAIVVVVAWALARAHHRVVTVAPVPPPIAQSMVAKPHDWPETARDWYLFCNNLRAQEIAPPPKCAGVPRPRTQPQPSTEYGVEAITFGKIHPPRERSQDDWAPSPVPATEPGDLLHDAARLLQAGDYDRAFDLAKEAVMAGGGERAHLMMGRALMAKSDFRGAKDELLRVEEMHPGDPEARQLLASLRDRRHSEQ